MTIQQLHTKSSDSNSQRRLKRGKANWLSAIAGQGFAPADKAFASVLSDLAISGVGEHPDFHSYMESWSGPGPTPYEPPQLVELLRSGALIGVLNAFQMEDPWRGPTKRALTDALETAVAMAPAEFVRALSAFDRAHRPYQYAVINGFRRLWDERKSEPQAEWDMFWPPLISFFERLLTNDAFWSESSETVSDLTPTKDWIAPAVAGFLAAANQKDDQSYADSLLPRSWKLIEILLRHCESVEELPKDPMTAALNSSKGKAVDAFIAHSLRICRLNDRTHGNHELAWDLIRPLLDRELSQCKDANFEFSTLVACHFPNFDYMNGSWLDDTFPSLFDPEYALSFQAALDGLSYAPASRRIYQLLDHSGVLDHALRLEPKGHKSRERLVERVGLAYLWGIEPAESARLQGVFNAGRIEDLETLIGFFWSLRHQLLSADQKAKLTTFWRRGVDWAHSQIDKPGHLMSSLSRLMVYLESVDAADAERLLQLAPYVHMGYRADDFVEELLRLVDTNVDGVAAAFLAMLTSSVPSFDYEDKMRKLVEAISAKGRRLDAIQMANQLRGLPGMEQFVISLPQPQTPAATD